MITDKAWLLHQQARGDTSLSLHMFTENNGLIRAWYKGGRNPRKKELLQNFTPVWLELAAGNHCYFIRKAEALEPQLSFSDQALICALYLNELLFCALKQPEPATQLFLYYEKSLRQLSQCRQAEQMAVVLRDFEWILLQHCGIAFSMQNDTGGDPIEANCCYDFDPETGFRPVADGIPGSAINAMAAGDFQYDGVQRYARRIMRGAIDHLLDYRPLHARKLLRDYYASFVSKE